MDNLNGCWKCVSAILGGESQNYKNHKSIIKGNTYRAVVNNQKDIGEIVIDASKNPKTLDIFGKEGPNKGKMIRAIYKLEGKIPTICFNLMGSNHPTDFTSTKENGFLLISYKKAPFLLSWF